MSSELEQRLARLLTAHPEPSPAAGSQARQAALAALPPGSRRPRHAAWLVLAAAGIAVVTTGVALAASPNSFRDLRDVVAPSPAPPKASRHTSVVRIPGGAAGFTVQVGTRLWVATPRGDALRAAPLAATATSPQALYAVGETRGRLEAISIADRHIAWSVPLAGRLVAAAWSPYPIRIAYVVAHRGHTLLHLIWGNGVNDQVVGPAAPVMPTWRSDSLAVAYVGTSGAVVLDSVGRTPRQFNPASACGAHRVTELAFSPNSATLAEATDGPRVILVDTRHPGTVSCIHTDAPVTDLHWLSPANLLFTHRGSDQLTRVATNHRRVTARGTLAAPGAILGLAPAPGGRSVAVAIRHGNRLRILTTDPPVLGAVAALRPRQQLSLEPPVGRDVRIGWS